MIKKSRLISIEEDLHQISIQNYKSPIGILCVAASLKGLKWIKMVGDYSLPDKPNEHTRQAISQLHLYFSRQLHQFDLHFDLEGYSDFSVRVWNQLQNIPYGKTINYMQLAKQLGDVKCIRAAGTANGRNPIPIIIPCHRVIGSDGSLTGFALGLDIKKQLLSLENPDKFNLNQVCLTF